MTSKFAKNKTTAKARASKARDMGLSASIFKKKKGYGVSVTRKKKWRQKKSFNIFRKEVV